MKVIFMGTPDIAIPALQAIFNSSHQIVGVYTRPPAKSGRGHKIHLSPVHALSKNLNIPVYCPVTFKDTQEVKILTSLQADVIVVSAYGHILPKSILEACPFGCINIHPSLLPRWRGAAPIERTVQAGDAETGVCIMQMNSGLDTGDILLIEKVSIDSNITTTLLYEKLSKIGGRLIVETLNDYHHITPVRQSEHGIMYAKKLSKEEATIDWSQTAEQIDGMVRAFNPWPGSYFRYNDKLIKILEASIVYDHEFDNVPYGTVIDEYLRIKCGNGILQPTKLQRPGRNILILSEFLLGSKVVAGTVLG